MEQSISYQESNSGEQATVITQLAEFRDSSGYTLFSQGEEGHNHAMAHWMLDHNFHQSGYEILGEWIDGRTGSGSGNGSNSDWVHLQWHMAVFELAVGKWDDAYSRFLHHILPVAASTGDALTDAPSLLWRLSLSSNNQIELPWEPVRQTALASLRRQNCPYVEIHNLLALAGAGDIDNLDHWTSLSVERPDTHSNVLVRQVAMALRAYCVGKFTLAGKLFSNVVPEISSIGGSQAQNQLFTALVRNSEDRARRSKQLLTEKIK